MNLIIKIPIWVVTIFMLAACSHDAIQPSDYKKQVTNESVVLETLYDFESAVLPADLTVLNGSAELIQNPHFIGAGKQALRVKLASAGTEYSALVIKPESPWNWSQYQDFNIAFNLGVQGVRSVQVFLDISDTSGKNYTRTVNIPVGPTTTYYSKMSGHDLGSPEGDVKVELNLSSGLRSNPPTWKTDDKQFIWMWGSKHLDLSAINKISLSVQNVLVDKEFTIDNIRLQKNPPLNSQYLTHIVDRYGQATSLDFAGKIHSDTELITAREQELKTLGDGKLMADRSQFGGWKNGPRLKATGFFRTEKVNDKWALIDPEGYLYFSTGIDVVRTANAYTMTGYDYDHHLISAPSSDDLTPEDSRPPVAITPQAMNSRTLSNRNRSEMFTWLPEKNDPLASHYSYNFNAHSGALKRGETFSFYTANLHRKYGELTPKSYLNEWREVTLKRMRSWGFTSFGNWADPMFYQTQRMPYFANGWIIGNFKTVSSGNDFWARVPDAFDPEFALRADATVQQVAKEVQGSPWCVGVFIDNEISWGRMETLQTQLGIVIDTLTRDGADVPAKNHFTQLLKNKYSDIRTLNQAWGKNIPSWDAFQRGIDSSLNEHNAAQVADYETLLYAFASQYLQVVRDSVKKYLPNHLYMGVRFADWGMPKPVLKAAAKYADVMSYNYYKEGLIKSKWEFLAEFDKPSLIGEFHMGTTSSGFFHAGMIHAADQHDRALLYKEYVRSFVDNPYFVGLHWFQYADSPITGRSYDGENYNVGFVSVTDTPYEPMVQAARETNSELYSRRFGSTQQ